MLLAMETDEKCNGSNIAKLCPKRFQEFPKFPPTHVLCSFQYSHYAYITLLGLFTLILTLYVRIVP